MKIIIIFIQTTKSAQFNLGMAWSTLEKQKQEDVYKFKTNLLYVAGSIPSRVP